MSRTTDYCNACNHGGGIRPGAGTPLFVILIGAGSFLLSVTAWIAGLGAGWALTGWLALNILATAAVLLRVLTRQTDAACASGRCRFRDGEEPFGRSVNV
ncbi:hypothetical protein [Celeribacter indicus]|uniref:Uncharacterized protein n=1 Tax=Celeribacter indicus TaxID=1208324 RepID=A0A0B5E070_9RHOB|nr:hypothetical protein [Celeribacter indicus]AJE45857.1 hypothetical protein P73_1142 [Celeribacter indicus]SDW62388.1 hypothetical protein SAMN05443573_10587 [Celeribacter indicus]